MGGGGQPDEITQISKTEVPEYVKPYLEPYIKQGQRLAELPYTPYPGPRLAGYSGDQLSAMHGIRNRAIYGDQNTNLAAGLAQQTARGDFFRPTASNPFSRAFNPLIGNNPYLSGQIGMAQDEIANQYMRATAPSTAALFNRAGAFGGTAHIQQADVDRENLARQLSNVSTTMRGEDYARSQGLMEQQLGRLGQFTQADIDRQNAALESERARQMQAIPLLQGISQERYADIQRLGLSGDAQRAMTQQAMDLAYQEFLARQQYPYKQLGFFGDVLNQAAGRETTGSTTAPNPNQSSPAAGAIGGALSGYAAGAAAGGSAALAGTAAGSWAGPVGALIGAGLGYALS